MKIYRIYDLPPCFFTVILSDAFAPKDWTFAAENDWD